MNPAADDAGSILEELKGELASLEAVLLGELKRLRTVLSGE